ncbi:phage minor head protein, partial [Morganella morganii]
MPTREAVDLRYAIGLPPAEAIAYFESKGYAIGFNYHDVEAQAHAKAFTVAGV